MCSFLKALHLHAVLKISIRRQKCTKLTVRHCSTGSEIGESEVVPQIKVLPKPRRLRKPLEHFTKPSSKVLEHFQSSNQQKILYSFPPSITGRVCVTKQSTLYVADPYAAELIADNLMKFRNQDVPLWEVNPGPGVLTEKLLRKGANHLKLFETNQHFANTLQELTKSQTNKNVSLYFDNLLSHWRHVKHDQVDNGNRVNELLAEVPSKDWKDDITFQLFACTGTTDFIKFLVYCIYHQLGLFSQGRAEFFLVLPYQIFTELTCNSDAGYRLFTPLTFLFQICCEYEYLDRMAQTSFLPLYKGPLYWIKHKLELEEAPNYLYLIRLVPRRNLLDLCSLKDLPALHFFIKQLLNSRKSRIIPMLEKWIPLCGPQIMFPEGEPEHVKPLQRSSTKPLPISSRPCTTMSNKDYFYNINIFSNLGEMTPSQLLTVFTQFTNLPNYKNSTFLEASKVPNKMYFQKDRKVITRM